MFNVSNTIYAAGKKIIKPIIFIKKSASWLPVFNVINFNPIRQKIADNINKKNCAIMIK